MMKLGNEGKWWLDYWKVVVEMTEELTVSNFWFNFLTQSISVVSAIL